MYNKLTLQFSRDVLHFQDKDRASRLLTKVLRKRINSRLVSILEGVHCITQGAFQVFGKLYYVVFVNSFVLTKSFIFQTVWLVYRTPRQEICKIDLTKNIKSSSLLSLIFQYKLIYSLLQKPL